MSISALNESRGASVPLVRMTHLAPWRIKLHIV